MASGKWKQLGVPHKGWSCVDIVDLEEPVQICEMCEVQEIRYVHFMEHPNYPSTLEVGCECAGNMEGDLAAAKEREQVVRNSARRKQNWLKRKWKKSRQGNSYIKTDGFHIVIYPGNGYWSGTITIGSTGQEIQSRKRYISEDAAKLGAFDGMIFLKRKGS